jgi:hypothetical protein
VRRTRPLVASLGLAALSALAAACVPADHALPLGSVAFHMKASVVTTEGFTIPDVEPWSVVVNRALFVLQTVTIGDSDDENRCSYRGRGVAKDVVFDALLGVTQTFNGLEPTTCPDVGFVFAPPGDGTVLGPGATGDDLLMLAAGEPAHAYFDMTVSRSDATYRLVLRFATDETPSRFAACRRVTQSGVRVLPNARVDVPIAFSADALFREALGGSALLRFSPFVDADDDRDHVITERELDALPLADARLYSEFYAFEDGSTRGSFGDFVRLQLEYAFIYDGEGVCHGNDPP